jgi:quinol monooxygenase YgiN
MPTAVSVHPYFRPLDGQREAVLALLPAFASRVEREEGCLYYEFFTDGDLVYCREAYRDAAAFEAHVANVGDLLERLLALSAVERLEVHGPDAEVARVNSSLADLGPRAFTFLCGARRK